jgi:hypothetical protein
MDHRKTAGPTLLVLLLICLAMGAWGLKTLGQGFPESPISTNSGPYCVDRQVAAGDRVYPQDVMVSVYNAGGRAGGASRIMGDLVDRGFAQGLTGNVDADVRRAEIWADDPKNPAVRLVARQFGKKTRVTGGHPAMGEGVVVVVGEKLRRVPARLKNIKAGAEATICSPPVDATE